MQNGHENHIQQLIDLANDGLLNYSTFLIRRNPTTHNIPLPKSIIVECSWKRFFQAENLLGLILFPMVLGFDER